MKEKVKINFVLILSILAFSGLSFAQECSGLIYPEYFDKKEISCDSSGNITIVDPAFIKMNERRNRVSPEDSTAKAYCFALGKNSFSIEQVQNIQEVEVNSRGWSYEIVTLVLSGNQLTPSYSLRYNYGHILDRNHIKVLKCYNE